MTAFIYGVAQPDANPGTWYGDWKRLGKNLGPAYSLCGFLEQR